MIQLAANQQPNASDRATYLPIDTLTRHVANLLITFTRPMCAVKFLCDRLCKARREAEAEAVAIGSTFNQLSGMQAEPTRLARYLPR